jgi:amino acid adenylation domain-containing protein
LTDVKGRLASLSLQEQALLFKRLREKREREKRGGRAAAREEGAPAPLSSAQQRLWFLDRLAPGSPLYNVATALHLAGPLDPAVLAAGFSEIVRRHEALRTRFAIHEGRPVQIPEPAAPLPLPVIDLSGLPPDLRGPEEERRIEEESRAPFDLTRPPLLRVRLVRLGEDEHLLLLTVHHIASDAWSIGVAVGELGALYPALAAGHPSPLPELPIQYADFARQERERLGGESLAREVAFWRGKLAGAEPPELPADHPRPAAPRFGGAGLDIALPRTLDGAVRAWAQTGRATLFMALLAPLSALLARIADGDDVVLGTTVTGRGSEKVAGLIGFFVNTLVLRTDLSEDPESREILARARTTTLEAFTHQELPFEKLIDELGLPRYPHRPPLLHCVLQLLNLPGTDLTLPGLTITSRPLPHEPAKFDLLVNVVDTPGGLRLEWRYDTDLFEGTTIARLSRAFEILLAGLVEDPERRLSDLPLLTEAERHQLVAEWNEAPAGEERGRAPIHHLFEAQVDRTPDTVAVSLGEERLTYRELDVRANRLARHLAAAGVRPGDLVALTLERSLGMVEAILATLKAGAGYLPLDPASPPERLAFALADSDARVVLTGERLEADREVIAARSGERLAIPADPELPAYVIYTSGSTGFPKGVVIPHGNVTRLFAATASWFGFGPEDVWTLFHSYAFDFSVWEIWGALLHGGRLVVVPFWETRSPEAFHTLLRDEQVTVLNQTPSAFRQLLWAEDAALSGASPGLALRLVIFGGEALEPESLAPWIERHGDERPRLVNLYGITETTVHATYRPVRREDLAPGRGSRIGGPLPDLSLHVLDRMLRPQPIGAAGEICVGGEGLALGYLGRPELTAERFVPDPFGAPGARLYRSGDLARRRPDGDVEYLGRIDHQVKIRGFRIEPGEIEAALVRHPAVREAVVAVRGDRLVAWVVPGSGEAPSLSVLRESLGSSLPEYMLPGALVVVDALPLTVNGKVDRRALPAPEAVPAPERGAEPPRTGLERFLAGLFAEVLRIPADRPVGRDDDFFELGGNSITGAILVNRLQEALSQAMKVAVIFDASTVARLAAFVEERHPGALEARRPERPAGPVEGRRTAPLSFSQERLWFLDRLMPGVATYNLPTPFRLLGPLAPAVLARCFEEIVRRHEALRTRFEEQDGTPVQVIDPPQRWVLPVADLSALPESRGREEAHRLTAEEAGQPFDLQKGPLLRTTLLRLAPEEHDLLLTAHHIVTDGWSVGILSKELVALYEAFTSGSPSPLPELPAQYADFARWQRERLSGAELDRQIAYWRGRLGDDPPALDLPLDRPRPALQTYRGASSSMVLPRGLSEGLKQVGLASRSSLFMTLLAGFEVLLHRMSGQDDVLVGTPVAGRLRVDAESLIGFFLNSLVLRTNLSGQPTFRELLLRVRETALGAYAHQEVPFEKLLEVFQPDRDLSRTPLFQVFFNLANFPDLDTRLPGGLTVEGLGAMEAESKFDLTVYAADTVEGIRLHLVYNADLFDAPRMSEMLRQYRAVLERVVEDPEMPVGALPLVTPEAAAVLPDPRALLGEEWQGAVHELFAERAACRPERPAVSDPEGSWTYGELARAAERLAARLQEAGVEKGDRVAVWAHRSAPVVWAVLGTLRAGAAFVMLDPAYPATRIVEMLRLAEPRAFLGIAAAGDPSDEVDAWLRETATWRLTLPGGGPEGARALSLPEKAPEVRVGPDDLAYVAFTSGSTGAPKGILGRHGPLSHFIPWQAERFGLDGEDRYSLLSGLAHDPLQRDMFTPLATGASLAAPAPDDLLVPGRLAAWAAREGITVAHLTPALGRVLTEPAGDGGAPSLVSTLRWVLLVGDVLTRLDVDRLRGIAPCVTCVNLYGSTETQRAVAYHVVDPVVEDGGPAADRVRQVFPLGRGMRDVQLLVLRPAGPPALAGVGEVGEICVRSPHLAAGYLGDEAGTRERFLTNPFTGRPGDRLYRTGDLGRYLPDGQVAFAGRADQQVKIRGFRIELGEIEAALGRLQGVKEAVVLALQDGPDPADRRLVAFVVGESAGDLRQALAAKLPSYMVPSAFVRLDRMPITPNGKVDRRALTARKDEAEGPRVSFVLPRTPAEQRMAGLWAGVLGLAEDRVGAHGNFFELGGHSLLATRLASRVQAAFGADLPLRAFFEAPTVAALTAVVLAEAGRGEGRDEPDLVRRSATEAPLSFSQERLWFLERLTPGTGMYNLPGAAWLRGPLDPGSLARAFGEIVRRHESLRTRFVVRADAPVQVIDPPAPWGLPLVDLSALPEGFGRPESGRLAREDAAGPFNLERGPLLRATLLRLGPGEHALLVTVHHIASDGWSQRLLLRELAAHYETFSSGAPPLPELPVQYADYAVWQRERLTGETLERQLAYWRERLGDNPPPLDLPLDRPRPAVQTFRGAAVTGLLPRALSESLQALAVGESASLFMVLLAGFELLLARQSGQDDVVAGAPVAGRLRPEVEDLIGFFLNTLVLRTDLSGRPTFRELVRRVRETALSAYAHQDVPFERLLVDLQPERDLSRTPLFQVFFNMLNLPPAAARLPSGLDVEPLGGDAGDARFDLTVYAAQGEEGIAFNLVYNADLFDEARMEELLRQYWALLAQAVEQPDAPVDRISLLTPEAVHLLPDPAVPLGDTWQGAVQALFAERARRHPERPALTDPEGTSTYGELAYAVRRLAARLRESGVEKGDRVAIWAHRSAPVAWAVLATLEAGAAFVMLDPAYPAPRIVEMLRLAAPRAFLGIAAAGDPPPEVEAWIAEVGLACRITLPGGGPRASRELVATLPQAGPAVEVGPDDLAYVAFTSGSTGIPKGILGRHGPLSHFLPWQAERFGLGAGDRYSLLSGLAHDPLQRDLFTPLCLGGAVVIPSFEEVATPGRLAAWMAHEGITVAHLTPALGQILTEPPGRGEEPASIPTLRWVLLVGDVLTRLDVDRIRRIAPHVTCVNLYGSTETQRAVAFHVVESGGTTADRVRQVLPLGRGMEDVQLLVVRSGEEPALAGVGEVGEIWVRSPHLAAGYLGDEALTRDRFRTNPWTGAAGDRLYRTGDLGRYLPDGQVAFAGRADQQVKIRGFRIELGEIEAALGRLPGVREAVVILRQDGPDPSSRRLAAYVVPDPERPPEVATLREALRAGLPAYMVPSAFVFLDRLPVTPNRKVDRRALPAPEETDSGTKAGYVEPGSGVEQTIAEVWREVLGVERVGVRHNFFDLGGHSLLLVRLHARLQEALGRDLALVDLFNYPNIRALAEHLGRQDGGTSGLGEARSRGQRQMEAARRQRELARTRRGPRRNTDE